jgi:NNP family nitrate/nitrite transporter-like MFS transporter
MPATCWLPEEFTLGRKIMSTGSQTSNSLEQPTKSATNQSTGGAAAGNTLQLLLATGGFAVCFAIFGSVSAMMPILKKQMNLTPVQVSIALALPVILGSLGRIPLGMLTDRFGARVMFTFVVIGSILPVVAMKWVNSYPQLLVAAFFCGLSLASFSVGTGFVSRWYPPQKQGFSLGVYGSGNIGQSLASFGAPLIVGAFGFIWGFWAFGLLAGLWLVLWLLLAHNPPGRVPPKTWADMVAPLRNRMSWVLSLYYFLTFGGFVAMAVYLPTLLTDLFDLSPNDAGLRTAGFVLLATLMRPLGGILADRIGGRKILLGVFPWVALMALFMVIPGMVTFTLGALGMAAAIGLGNGAVFKLAPEYFPKEVGVVTGLIGAAGGLGGFFPPLLLGAMKQNFGHYGPGFVALSLFALGCWAVCRAVKSPTNAVMA